jgi:hypothetical protein
MTTQQPPVAQKPNLLELVKKAHELESKQAHTAFGKMPLSYEGTAPNYAFTKSRREDQAKVFLGDLTVQENMAKGSPGPVYKYEDKVKYKDVSLFLTVTCLVS